MKLWHKLFLPLPSLAIGLEREGKKEVKQRTFEVSIPLCFMVNRISRSRALPIYWIQARKQEKENNLLWSALSWVAQSESQ
jgi:hypothetical protein